MKTTATVLRNRLIARARIRHLQVFVSVAELGSVKRAAEAVGLAQPTLTHALADLEALLECALFLRHARGMRATPAGQALLPVARRILASIDDGAEQVVALTEYASGVVRVAAITAAIAGLLVRAIPEFANRHPEVLVQLQEADPLQQSALLTRGEIDISMCRSPSVTPAGWRFVPLFDDRFAVVAGPGHPLLRRRRVGMAELCKATWLVAPTTTAAREAFDRLFAEQPSPPRTSPVVTRVPAMFWAMLTRQPLLAILPASFARQLIDAGQIFELSLDHELPFEPTGMLLPVEGLGEGGQTLVRFLEAFAAQERAAPVRKAKAKAL
jgi:DNA-binding transcriptional LysR family regulator